MREGGREGALEKSPRRDAARMRMLYVSTSACTPISCRPKKEKKRNEEHVQTHDIITYPLTEELTVFTGKINSQHRHRHTHDRHGHERHRHTHDRHRHTHDRHRLTHACERTQMYKHPHACT